MKPTTVDLSVASLQYELAEEKNATANDRDVDYRLERSASQNNALAATIVKHVATIEELRAENSRQAEIIADAKIRLDERRIQIDELIVKNARQAETNAKLQARIADHCEWLHARGYYPVAEELKREALNREQPAGEEMTEELTEVDIDEIGVCLHNDVGPAYQEHMCKKLRRLRERERLLVAACEAAGEVIGLAESATERYEVLAEAFYRETGKMAPGKSVPLAMAMNDDEDRRKTWAHWVNTRMTACRGLLRAAIRK